MDSKLGQQQQQLSESSICTEAARQTGQEEREEVIEQYCAQLYSRKLVNVWKVDFVVTKDLECCLTVSINYCMHVVRCTFSTQVVKKEYYTQCIQHFSFVFTYAWY